MDKVAHQRRFLSAFVAYAHIGKASRAAQITRRQHYHWLDTDPEYVKDFARAERESWRVLVDEAVRRGVDGVDEPVFHKGKVVGKIRRFSDACLMGLIRGKDPDFRDKSDVRVSDADGKPLMPSTLTVVRQVLTEELAPLPAEARERIAERLLLSDED